MAFVVKALLLNKCCMNTPLVAQNLMKMQSPAMRKFNWERFRQIYIYIYTYIYTHTHIHTYIFSCFGSPFRIHHGHGDTVTVTDCLLKHELKKSSHPFPVVSRLYIHINIRTDKQRGREMENEYTYMHIYINSPWCCPVCPGNIRWSGPTYDTRLHPHTHTWIVSNVGQRCA